MTLAARLFAEADRREAAADAERRSRRAALLRKYERPRIAPQSVASALTMFAGLLWFGVAMMAFAGLLAVL